MGLMTTVPRLTCRGDIGSGTPWHKGHSGGGGRVYVEAQKGQRLRDGSKQKGARLLWLESGDKDPHRRVQEREEAGPGMRKTRDIPRRSQTSGRRTCVERSGCILDRLGRRYPQAMLMFGWQGDR